MEGLWVSQGLVIPGVRVPTAHGKRGKQGKWPKKFHVRENTGNLDFFFKTQGILSEHRENTGNGNTQGILLAQVVNVLIL